MHRSNDFSSNNIISIVKLVVCMKCHYMLTDTHTHNWLTHSIKITYNAHRVHCNFISTSLVFQIYSCSSANLILSTSFKNFKSKSIQASKMRMPNILWMVLMFGHLFRHSSILQIIEPFWSALTLHSWSVPIWMHTLTFEFENDAWCQLFF